MTSKESLVLVLILIVFVIIIVVVNVIFIPSSTNQEGYGGYSDYGNCTDHHYRTIRRPFVLWRGRNYANSTYGDICCIEIRLSDGTIPINVSNDI